MPSLNTRISLPPGPLADTVVREFLRLAFGEFGWFKPARYGLFGLNEKLEPGANVHDVLVSYYDEWKALSVAARTDRDFFLISTTKRDDPPFAGAISWATAAPNAKKPEWREAHLRQVAEVMRLVGSPFAYSGLGEDIERKTQQLVPHPSGLGRTQVFTVRDFSEGLAGLFWRNFYGPPFTRLFGERLATLPAGTREDLGSGIILVQPYESPMQAGSPEGDARERELIHHLGPECFYDHAHHLKPTRLPELFTLN
jgi:hypothetical protein